MITIILCNIYHDYYNKEYNDYYISGFHRVLINVWRSLGTMDTVSYVIYGITEGVGLHFV